MSKFKLPDSFIDTYRDRPVAWGYGALSETVFLRSYSQLKEDGTKERWYELCRRVIEAMFDIQKEHCKTNKLPWNQAKAQRSAKDAYERMFEFKWTPPGRGLARMGTPIVDKIGSLSLFNCSSITTEEFVGAMEYLMDAAMLGVGIGYDTKAAGQYTIQAPETRGTYVIPDSREGWVEATRKILMGYIHGEAVPELDYSQIRPKGAPISSGGVAPGPDPLILLHERLYKLFDGRYGEKLTIADVVDVGNMIGACVVSGGNRRTALIAVDDSFGDEFLDLKNLEKNPYREGWWWASNNSVQAEVGQDLSSIIDGIVRNGEPGVIWTELAQNYGRLIDPPDYADLKATIPNPCQPAWAPVITRAGLSTIGQIQLGDEIWSEAGWTTVVDKWSNGVKPVFAYRTTAGTFYGTENHRLVSQGQKIEAKDCDSIDRLVGPQPEFSGDLEPNDVMAGLLIGDGTVHGASNKVLLCIGADDQDYFGSEVAHLIGDSYANTKMYRVTTSLTHADLPHTYDRSVPDGHFYSDQTTVRGFLRGLYSANGSLVHNSTGRRVTLKATSFNLVERVQMMLSSIGIRSYYTTNKEKSVEFDNGVYVCKQSYDLNITSDIDLFAELVGFIHGYKTEKLQEMVSAVQRKPKTKQSFDIKEIETLGEEEVWDITVDNEPHTYWTGGLNVSNCGEIMLESMFDKVTHKAGGEVCNLSTINFNRHNGDLSDYLRTIKYAFLYNKVVTLIPTHNEFTNSIALRNRRIGASPSGVANFIDHHGMVAYRKWTDAGYKAICKWDTTYSSWLGVRESIRKTAVKPDGSMSTLSGESPGVHFSLGGQYFIRRVEYTKGEPVVNALREAGYRVVPSLRLPESFEVVEFPIKSDAVRNDGDVSAFEKMMIAAETQAYWADNMVSCTVSFDPETEGPQLGRLLQLFDGKLKGISFLPKMDHGYKQLPYEGITEEQYLEMSKDLKPVDYSAFYDGASGESGQGDSFCTTDSCEAPPLPTLAESVDEPRKMEFEIKMVDVGITV